MIVFTVVGVKVNKTLVTRRTRCVRRSAVLTKTYWDYEGSVLSDDALNTFYLRFMASDI